MSRERAKDREWDHWPYHLFILINTILFCFSILYLGIHWFTDIPLGMIIGSLGALLYIISNQGLEMIMVHFSKELVELRLETRRCRRHLYLIYATIILMAVNFQMDKSDENVSFRLGPQDSTFEIIQEISYGDYVDSTITNLDDSLHWNWYICKLRIVFPQWIKELLIGDENTRY